MMQPALDIILRLVGAFYVFAGFLVMRGAVMDRMMDQMLGALTLQPQPSREAQKRALWIATAFGITMGGAALMVLSLWAMPLFVLGLVPQVVYLLWARTAFPPENPLEEKGRRQTTNAAILYGVVTLGVLAAAWSGLLRPWLDPWALAAPIAGIALMASVGRHLIWTPRKTGFRPGDDDDEGFDDASCPEPEPPPPLTRVRLEPRWGNYPLVDADTGEDRFAHHYVPADLANRIHRWSYIFGADDDERSLFARFEDEAHEAAHRREGEAIVAELKTIFGADNASGPHYPQRSVYGVTDIALPVARVKLEPRQGRYAFVDAETGTDHPPELYVPVELADRIHWWSMAFETEEPDAPPIVTFEDRDDEARHRREGDEIVAELRAIFGAENVEGPIYPANIAYVGPGIDAEGNRLKAPGS